VAGLLREQPLAQLAQHLLGRDRRLRCGRLRREEREQKQRCKARGAGARPGQAWPLAPQLCAEEAEEERCEKRDAGQLLDEVEHRRDEEEADVLVFRDRAAPAQGDAIPTPDRDALAGLDDGVRRILRQLLLLWAALLEVA
jgi:hypothetical protein